MTTAAQKQVLNSQQPLQVSTEPGQQLELIPATPSIQQYTQQMILPPCDELHQQLNQSQVTYPQHFNTSLNSSSVSPNQPTLHPFLTSTLIQTPSSLPTTSQDNTATLINSYTSTITGTINTTTNSS